MNNLVSAALRRLWKSRVFYVCLAIMFAISASNIGSWILQAERYADDSYIITIDDCFFSTSPFVPLVCSIFISLLTGTEYSDGAIRNKIIVGKSRRDIYLSNLCVNIFGSLLMLCACYLPEVIAMTYFGGFKMPFTQLAVHISLSALLICSASSILTALVMLCHKKAVSAVSAILIVFLMLALSSMVYWKLEEPPTISGYSLTVDGHLAFTDPYPNPDYVGGATRELYYFILDALPTGPLMTMSNNDLHSPLNATLYSIVIILVAAGVGVTAFDKKDLK